MRSKNSTKVLVIGNTMNAMLYHAILESGGYKTRLFTRTEECDSSSRTPSLCAHIKEILASVLDFHPHLIVFSFEVGIDKVLARMDQVFSGGKRPLIAVVVPTGVWCENVDVCIPGPVGPGELLQAVRELLEEDHGRVTDQANS